MADTPTLAPPADEPDDQWDLIWKQFRRNTMALRSVYVIAILFLLAAWAPVLANGRPLVWRESGVTSYPLLRHIVAPSHVFGVDHVFDILLVATLVVPLAVLLAIKTAPPALRRPERRQRALVFGAVALGLCVIPFLGFVQWRLDARDYPREREQLQAARGDYAVFPLVAQDPITPTNTVVSAPSGAHWLGTDKDGRDVLARMIHGGRVSLSVGFVVVGIEVVLGIFFGALAGFFRGWVDIAISRFIEIVVCFPSFFLVLSLVAFIDPDKRSVFHIMIIMGITGWTGMARLVRGEFLKLADQDFVQSARAIGCSNARLMFRHMLPNAASPLMVAAAFGVAGAVLMESSLAYLGFGAPPPTPTWGEMIGQGKETMAWWLIIFPGASIFVTVTVFNLAGDGLRDAMDPKMRK